MSHGLVMSVLVCSLSTQLATTTLASSAAPIQVPLPLAAQEAGDSWASVNCGERHVIASTKLGSVYRSLCMPTGISLLRGALTFGCAMMLV